jgi:CRP/FNR family transcriptional regulator, cyclic AMP receptor protein
VTSGLFNYLGQPDRDGGFVLLADVPDADWVTIREHAELRRYVRGEVVSQAGDADRTLWIVVDGTVDLIDGRKLIDELSTGSVFGELTFLTGRPAPLTARAATDAAVLRWTLSSFEVVAAKDPDLARRVLFDLAGILALRLIALRQIARR